MKTFLATAALLAGLALAGGAQAQSITLSCTNADNPNFPIAIDLPAGRAETRGEGIASVLAGDNSVRFFFPHPNGIVEFDVSRVTLAARDRWVPIDGSVMSGVLAMPRRSAEENAQAAARMSALVSDKPNAWNAVMVCKKVERAF